MEDHLAADADRRRLRARHERRHVDDEVAVRLCAAGKPPALARARPASNARASSGETGTVAVARSRTRHFLQVPWPPQVESIAMPFQDAASKTVTPGGTRTAVPDGSKRSVTRAGAVGRAGSSPAPPASVTPVAASACARRCAAIQFDAPLVAAEEQVGGAARLDGLRGAGVHDRARQPGVGREREERGVRARAGPGSPNETFDAPSVMFSPNSSRTSADRLERGQHRLRVGADRHRQRVDHDVLERDLAACRGRCRRAARRPRAAPRAVCGMPVSSLTRQMTAAPCSFTSGSTALEPLVLAGHRVDERLALVGGEPGLERLDDGRVDAERQVGVLLDEP